MADPPPYPDSGEHTGAPRWVKMFGIIALVLVLLLVILLLIGGPGGGHGPGRHALSGGGGSHTSPSSVMEPGALGGHAPFESGH